MSRVLIAMSGGVDSSVAAYLMTQAGHECAGVTMKLFESQGHSPQKISGESLAGSPDDNLTVSSNDSLARLQDDGSAESVNSQNTQTYIEDAQIVCRQLDIPHHLLDLSDDFADEVIDRFVQAYTTGTTPNPCVDCNRFIKFGKLLHKATELGYDLVVTGHYARVGWDEATGRYLLRRGLDSEKDQSYVLYTLNQEQLAKVHLPLGELTKEQVRTIAREQGLIAADKGESQDICFVPDGDYAGFICEHTGYQMEPGPIVDVSGKLLGVHKGVIGYTIGQRKGIGIAAKEPLYVKAIDAATNTVIVGGVESLYSSTAIVKDVNLIAFERLAEPLQATAKHRYRQLEKPVTVHQLDESTLRVDFEQPQKALTKGQALVIYLGEVVVGGGTITSC